MRVFIFFALLVYAAGCASVEVVKITDANKNTAKGARFYRPYPYILVTKDKDGVVKSETIWLPNIKEEYAINMKSGMGTVNGNFALTNGWQLTQLGVTSDSKLPETMNAATSLIATAAKTFFKAENPGKSKQEAASVQPGAVDLEPGLYRYEFDANGVITDVVPVKLKQGQE